MSHAASPEVGPGAFVGTLKTGYPCIKPLSQDKEQDMNPYAATQSCSFGPHLPAEVGSGVATCPAAPDLTSLLR
jgi:hypothetical protein